MKITKRQLRRIIKEAFDEDLLTDKYGLYDGPETDAANAEFDALMDEVAAFNSDARKKLNDLMKKYSNLGTNDWEASDAIDLAFKDAKSGMRQKGF
jgi:hypothetical protein